jgi:hypothetical protein
LGSTEAGGADEVAKVGGVNERAIAAVRIREIFQGNCMDEFWAMGEES